MLIFFVGEVVMMRFLPLILPLSALSGCSTPSVITLKDGSRIETKDAPRMNQDGFYACRGIDGVDASVNGAEVLKIEER